VDPRDAATLMLLRDGADGLEVLMLRRRMDSGFVPGAWVFPGGAVDPEDHLDSVSAEAHTTGLTDQQASRILEVTSGGRAFWVAAVRETFEEAGVLMAFGSDAVGPAGLIDYADREHRFAEHRTTVDDGGPLVEVCRDEQVQLGLSAIHYFGRWITPFGAPRRYDTRFFVAAAPSGQRPSFDGRETVEERWVRPVDALAGHRSGTFQLIVPTVRSLAFLSGFGVTSDAVESVADATACHHAPALVEDNGGWRVPSPTRVGGE
jgi:8-oxo-dGTP pyrophosphatase MutT (NUDIX family)